jgi:uncharacterized membrane protein YedE/YeeE
VIGGLLFGFGIVLAGGCETGWMYRAVEGQVHYWWGGLGNIIGATWLLRWQRTTTKSIYWIQLVQLVVYWSLIYFWRLSPCCGGKNAFSAPSQMRPWLI